MLTLNPIWVLGGMAITWVLLETSQDTALGGWLRGDRKDAS